MTDLTKKTPDAAALERRQFLRQLAALPPRRRLDAIIDRPDAAAVVRALPAEDLYFTIQEVGLADATDLVQLASPAQFRTFVDLGGWKKDRIEPHQVLTWLRAARGEDGADFLQKLHQGTDLEVLEFLLREFTAVHDLEEDPDVNPEGVTLETPEGRYLVEFKVEGAELAGLRQLINDLIAENPFEAVRLMEAVRWEVPSELEETAYRFRSARLGDLGFPTLEDAVRLFSWVEPPPPPARAPGAAALAPAAGAPVNYLEAALRSLSDVEAANLEDEVRALANAVLVAEVADPGDLEATRQTAEMARDYLMLGLEHLTGGDPERAADVVREQPLSRIFQVGFSLTLRLKHRADRLARAPLARLDGAWLLLPEELAGVEALRRKRPRRALRVEGAEPVPFRNARELALSAALLERAEAQVAIFSALLGGTEDHARTVLARFGLPLEDLGAERLLAAALALGVLDGAVDVRPVPAGRTVELGERLFEGEARAPRLRASALERALAALTPAVPTSAHPELRRVVDVTLHKLLAELGTLYLQEGRLDPIASVILPMEGALAP